MRERFDGIHPRTQHVPTDRRLVTCVLHDKDPIHGRYHFHPLLIVRLRCCPYSKCTVPRLLKRNTCFSHHGGGHCCLKIAPLFQLLQIFSVEGAKDRTSSALPHDPALLSNWQGIKKGPPLRLAGQLRPSQDGRTWPAAWHGLPCTSPCPASTKICITAHQLPLCCCAAFTHLWWSILIIVEGYAAYQLQLLDCYAESCVGKHLLAGWRITKNHDINILITLRQTILSK